MTELILLAVIIGLLAVIAYQEHSNRLERSKMINAIIAKSSIEMRDLEIADKTKIEIKQENKPSEFVSTDQMSSEEWDKYIEDQSS